MKSENPERNENEKRLKIIMAEMANVVMTKTGWRSLLMTGSENTTWKKRNEKRENDLQKTGNINGNVAYQYEETIIMKSNQ